MDTVEASPPRRKIPRWLVPAVGYSISAVSLIWVFSKFPFAQLGEHLRTMDWKWIAVAVICEIAIFFVDAWRWMVLLKPVGAPSFGCCVQSVFVGIFANDILPAKAGELIRCFLLSFKTEVPLSLALTSDFIERIMDGLWVLIIYLVVTHMIGTHTIVSDAMWVFGTVVIAISCLILWILFHHQHAHHFVNNTGWAARFIHLLDEIHRLGDWGQLGKAMGIGGLYWAGQVFAVWAICRADAFDFSVGETAYLVVVRTVGTVIPSAPANVGLYQYWTIRALEGMLTEGPQAKVLAEIIFAFLTLPPLVGGAIAIALAGLNLGDLHRHAHHAHSTRKLKKHPADRPEVH